MIKLSVTDNRESNLSAESAMIQMKKILINGFAFIAQDLIIISNIEDGWLVMGNDSDTEDFSVFLYLDDLADYLYYEGIRAKDLIEIKTDNVKISIQVELD